MEKKSQIIFLEDSKGIVKIKDKIGNLFVLSDDEIKEDNWYYSAVLNEIFKCEDRINLIDVCKKIIATTNPELNKPSNKVIGNMSLNVMKNGIPSISQSDIEYIINLYNEKGKEVNVEKLAEKRALFHYPKYADDPDNYESRERIKIGFIDGYNKFLQDNADKKFSLEDVEVAILRAFMSGAERNSDITEVKRDIIQSLTKEQLKNDTVMVEYEKYNDGFTPDISFYKPKLKDNCIIIYQ